MKINDLLQALIKLEVLAFCPLLQHLLTRHFVSPMMALREQIEEYTEGSVLRLTRSWVGPFWFPGIALPDGVPDALGKGLLLHLSTEVVAIDVHHAMHIDPLMDPPPHEVAPEGQRIFRERRFAASANVMDALVELCRVRDVRCPITPIEGRARRRAL